MGRKKRNVPSKNKTWLSLINPARALLPSVFSSKEGGDGNQIQNWNGGSWSLFWYSQLVTAVASLRNLGQRGSRDELYNLSDESGLVLELEPLQHPDRQ